MTTDHVGPGSGVGHDYLHFPGDGFGFGYSVAVRTALGEMRLAGSIGELKWDSGSGTYFGVNPELDMIYILMEQVDKERGPIRDSLRKLVYGVFSPLMVASARLEENDCSASNESEPQSASTVCSDMPEASCISFAGPSAVNDGTTAVSANGLLRRRRRAG
jgi:CubicO group peptidase (beta-lactamase class C family)